VDSSAQQRYSVGQCYDPERKRDLVEEVNGQAEHKLWQKDVSSLFECFSALSVSEANEGRAAAQ